MPVTVADPLAIASSRKALAFSFGLYFHISKFDNKRSEEEVCGWTSAKECGARY